MLRLTLILILVLAAACRGPESPAEGQSRTILASSPAVEQTPARDMLSAVPDTAEVDRLLSMARMLELEGESLEAESFYRRALEVGPEMDRPLTEYGNFLLRTGRPEASVALYQDVIDQNPDRASAHNGLASAFSALEWYPEALEAAQEALRLNPGYVDAMTNLGTMQARLGDLDAGAATLREAAMRGYEEGNLTPVLNYGLVALEMGEWSEAISSLGLIVVSNPDNADMRILLARAMIGKGDPISALAQVNAGLKANPGHPESLALKAELEAAKKQ